MDPLRYADNAGVALTDGPVQVGRRSLDGANAMSHCVMARRAMAGSPLCVEMVVGCGRRMLDLDIVCEGGECVGDADSVGGRG